jgi:hypothetical protein
LVARGLQCRSEAEKDPLAQEDKARLTDSFEHGGATLLAMGSNGDMMPSLGRRRREQKPQMLVEAHTEPPRPSARSGDPPSKYHPPPRRLGRPGG